MTTGKQIIKTWERNGNIFLFHTSETILELMVLSDRILRFRYASDGNFQRDHSYAISDKFEESLMQLAISETETPPNPSHAQEITL